VRRRVVQGLLAMTLLLVSGDAAAKLMSVAVTRANFRDGPSLAHEVLFTGERYFPVKVLERQRGWAKIVDFEGERAWVAARLLCQRDTVAVSVQRGNVRAGPGLAHGVIAKVEYGEVYRIAERQGRWLRLATTDDTIGWVRNDLTWGDEDG